MRHFLVLGALALSLGACSANKDRAAGPYAIGGQVVNEAGAVVAGAKVNVGGIAVESDAQGRFSAKLAQAPSSFVPVNVAATGYVSKAVRLNVVDATPPPLNVVLRQIGLTTEITMPQPGEPPAVVTLQTHDAVNKLSFAAGCLSHSDGSAVTGKVTIHLTCWNPGEAMTSAPGPLAALVGAAGSCLGLNSLGMINFDAEQNGAPCQVTAGMSVLWQSVLPPCAQSLLSSVSSICPLTALWSLDSSQCAFVKQAGCGTTTGASYTTGGNTTGAGYTNAGGGATSVGYTSGGTSAGYTSGGTSAGYTSGASTTGANTTGGNTTGGATSGGYTSGGSTTGAGDTSAGGTTGYVMTTGGGGTTGYAGTTGGTTTGYGDCYGVPTQITYDGGSGTMTAPVPATGTWNYDYVCNQAGGCMTTSNGGCVQGRAMDCSGKPLANQNVNIYAMGRSNMLQGGGNFGVARFTATTDANGHYCKTIGIEPAGYGEAAATVPIYVSGTDSPLQSNQKCPLQGSCQVCDQTDPLCNTCANGTPNGVLSPDANSYVVQRGVFCPDSACTQIQDVYIGAACQGIGACPAQPLPTAAPCDMRQVPNSCCGDPSKATCADGVCVPSVGGTSGSY